MSEITESGLKALVSLLLDDDPKTVAVARRKLIEHAGAARPILADSVRSDDPRLRARARPVLEEIRVRELEDKLREWSESAPEGGDLETGAYLVASYATPDLDPSACARAVDAMALEVGARLGDERRASKVVETLSAVLFGEFEFRGNRESYYDPDNSYIDKVIARRTGIPISLSALVLFVSKRLDLPIHGVTMPCHFIVRYESPEARVYFDPFNGGKTLAREECLGILKELGVEPNESLLAAATPRYVLRRMVSNLKQIYEDMKDEVRQRHFARFLEILNAGGA